MGGSVEGLLCWTLVREPAEAATMLRLSHVSRWPAVTYISAAVLDISRKATAVKERADCTVLLTDCIPVHETHVSPATTFAADEMCVSCTVDAVRLRLWCVARQLTMGQSPLSL